MGALARITSAIRQRFSMGAVPIFARQHWWEYRDVHEPYPGAWQQDVTPARTENATAFSAVYACISLISGDIAKLRPKLVELTNDGIWVERNVASYSPVLRKPNRYQTRIQFLAYWIACKLLYGNAYILKEYDARRVVTSLYPLDPRCVKPLVTDDGDVYYDLNADNLSGLQTRIVVPAEDIIHDRMNCLFHPLCGVSPIYACALSVTQGQKIQRDSARFFSNASKPSGLIIAPTAVSPEEAERLKKRIREETSGHNSGGLLLLTNNLKYEPMTIPARDAQLIDQLKWSAEDAARPFLMPLHKLGLGNPTVNNAAQYNMQYYQDCVQKHIEDIEELLDDGLRLGPRFGNAYGVELDLEGLLRMDETALAEKNAKEVGAGYLKIDEARKRVNLPPVEGGDSCYLQQQNYSLSALARRDAQDDPFATGGTSALPEPNTEDDSAIEARALLERLSKGFEHVPV